MNSILCSESSSDLLTLSVPIHDVDQTPYFMDLDRTNNKKSYTDKITGNMNIYQQNVRGLATKLGELIGHLHPHYPQIMCVTEHQLKQATNKTYNNGKL